MLFPKKTKYKKHFKSKIKIKKKIKKRIIFGQYALKSVENTRLTNIQIEACRKTILKKMKKIGVLYINIFPDKPVTSKPNENRMGKGKGLVSLWVSNIYKGQVLYEIGGLNETDAKLALISGAKKLPIKTKFVLK